MDNLPVWNKCCFCVPLRYGLLTWGYLKLAASLIALSFYILILVVLSNFINPSDPSLMTIASLSGLLLTSEIVLHMIFIIGAHQKMVKLLKVYYYYALFMWVVIIIMSIGGTVFIVINFYGESTSTQALFDSMGVIVFLVSFITQTFLVLSLRSEIIKLRSNCPYRFVRNEHNSEGTVHSVPMVQDCSTVVQDASTDTARIL